MPLLAMDQSFVIPTVGPLVEGWLLVVTRKHDLALRDSDESAIAEVARVQASLRRTLEDTYGRSVIAFEHGPVKRGSTVGCGIDHAHLHVIPVGANIRPAIDCVSGLAPLRWMEVAGLNSVKAMSAEPYLYMQDAQQVHWVACAPAFPSQLVRRAIAQIHQEAGHWDWRTNENAEIASASVVRLRPMLSAISSRNSNVLTT
jgi:diadenosine tetraphosphate (Ap4A) HIT family hydrolase